MPSLRSRLFYVVMKTFFGLMVPPNLPVETYRKVAGQPLFERMPRGIGWQTGEVQGVPGEWVTPSGMFPSGMLNERILLYLHGGGYVLSTPHVHRVLVGRLARGIRCRAFMPDYPLAPEHPFPAALDAVATVYRGLLTDGYKPEQIVVAGDSAGGGLTAALLVSLRDQGEPLPASACLISALLDCSFSGEGLTDLQRRDPYLRLDDLQMMATHYRGTYDPRHPLVSPFWADLHGLPPLMILAGQNEVLVEQSIQFARHAQQAGVEVTLKVWDGMIHAFPLFAGFIPEGARAIEEIARFLEGHLPQS